MLRHFLLPFQMLGPLCASIIIHQKQIPSYRDDYDTHNQQKEHNQSKIQFGHFKMVDEWW